MTEAGLHLAALSLPQLRAALRALADTAQVDVLSVLDEGLEPPRGLSVSEWSALSVLRAVYVRGCELEGVDPGDGWLPEVPA